VLGHEQALLAGLLAANLGTRPGAARRQVLDGSTPEYAFRAESWGMTIEDRDTR
jgi:hypothetical protein